MTHTLPAMQHAGRHLMQHGLLVADDERVAGIAAALVADDDVGVLREDVDDLALALVAPLDADAYDRWHAVTSPVCSSVRSQLEHFRRDDVRQLAQPLQHGGRNALVDVHERQRHAADLLATELQTGDVDLRLAEQRSDARRRRRARRGCAT